MKKIKTQNGDAQKKQSSREVRGVSPEAGRFVEEMRDNTTKANSASQAAGTFTTKPQGELRIRLQEPLINHIQLYNRLQRICISLDIKIAPRMLGWLVGV